MDTLAIHLIPPPWDGLGEGGTAGGRPRLLSEWDSNPQPLDPEPRVWATWEANILLWVDKNLRCHQKQCCTCHQWLTDLFCHQRNEGSGCLFSGHHLSFHHGQKCISERVDSAVLSSVQNEYLKKKNHTTDLRIFSTNCPKGFSQQYILMTRIPAMISFITFTRSSVWTAVLRLYTA